MNNNNDGSEINTNINFVRKNIKNTKRKGIYAKKLPINGTPDRKYVKKITVMENVNINIKMDGYITEMKTSANNNFPVVLLTEQVEELECGTSIYYIPNTGIKKFEEKVNKLHQVLINDDTFIDFGWVDVNDYISSMMDHIEENESIQFTSRKQKTDYIIQRSMLSSISGSDDNMIGIFKLEQRKNQYFLVVKTTNEIACKMLHKKIYDNAEMTLDEAYPHFLDLREKSQLHRDILAYNICSKLGIDDNLKTRKYTFIDKSKKNALTPMFNNIYNCLVKNENMNSYSFYNHVYYIPPEDSSINSYGSKGGAIYKINSEEFEIFMKNVKKNNSRHIISSDIPDLINDLSNGFPMHVPYNTCSEKAHRKVIKKSVVSSNLDNNTLNIKGDMTIEHRHTSCYYDHDEYNIDFVDNYFEGGKTSIVITCCSMIMNSYDNTCPSLLRQYHHYVTNNCKKNKKPSLNRKSKTNFCFCRKKYKNLLDHLHNLSLQWIDDKNNNINGLCYKINNQKVIVPANVLCNVLWQYNPLIKNHIESDKFDYDNDLLPIVGKDYQCYPNIYMIDNVQK